MLGFGGFGFVGLEGPSRSLAPGGPWMRWTQMQSRGGGLGAGLRTSLYVFAITPPSENRFSFNMFTRSSSFARHLLVSPISHIYMCF